MDYGHSLVSSILYLLQIISVSSLACGESISQR